MGLLLEAVVQVHQINGLQAKVLLACPQLVLQKIRVHAVYLASYILLGDLALVYELLNQCSCWYAPISIVRNVARFARYKDLIPAQPLFFWEILCKFLV